MPFDPADLVAEILGEPAGEMRNPANAEYQCPYINGECIKTSQQMGGAIMPVCTVYKKPSRRVRARQEPICVCPKRFYERQLQNDVIEYAWAGPRPQNPHVAHEVSLQKFGKVDMVVADIDPQTRRVRQFVSVELQAVDITGSYVPAYEAVTNNRVMERPPVQNFNWANVRKRFISQLIAKGHHHHHWGTRIAAVLQTDLFERFQAHARLPEVAMADSNIVFMLYRYRSAGGGRWQLQFDRAVPTTHASVMQAILYEQPPSRAEFERRIKRQLGLED